MQRSSEGFGFLHIREQDLKVKPFTFWKVEQKVKLFQLWNYVIATTIAFLSISTHDDAQILDT